MDLLQAILLGIVQGLSEFLPISSSGHLILVPWLFGWDAPLLNSLAFDAALHVGTGLALLGVFWSDLWGYVLAVGRGIVDPAARRTPGWRLAWMIVVASLPGVLLALLGEHVIEDLFRSPVQVASLLIAFGLALYILDRYGRKTRTLDQLGWWDAIVVGLAQALALMPGVSRSGVTMSAGLALGQTREVAARWSFLIATPVTMGAGLYKLLRTLGEGGLGSEGLLFAAGVGSSAIVGWLVIRSFLVFVRRSPLTPFVLYRVLVGVGALALVATGLRPG